MAAVPMPSYSSAVSSLPRLRGDGMDSDTLNNKATTPLSSTPPNPPPPRHRNLNSSTKAATVARAQKPRHVPREPIKGAVGQMNGLPLEQRKVSSYKPDLSGSKGIMGKGSTEITQAWIPTKLPDNYTVVNYNDRPISKSQSSPPNSGNLVVNKTNLDQYSIRRTSNTEGKSSDESGSQKSLYEYSYEPLSNNTPRPAKKNSFSNSNPVYHQSAKVQNPAQGNVLFQNPAPGNVLLNQDKIVFSPVTNTYGSETLSDSGKLQTGIGRNFANVKSQEENRVRFDIGETRIDIDGVGKGSGSRGDKDDVVVSMTPPPAEERQVEGQSRPSEDLTKLQGQVSSLSGELQQQVKVNTDLKKLLVASVGDDLQWRMDALVQTKTQLGTEICDYTKKIEKDYEQLDQLSIQADMWRSKFMATRVLIDQLASEKESLSARWKEAERALKQLMSERQQLHETMVESHRYLKLLRDSFDPVFARKTESIIPNILELARTNLLLSEAVKFKLLGSLPVLTVALDAGIQNGLTPAEKIAYQVLMDSMEPPGSVLAPGRLPAQKLHHFGRFHPQVQYEGITCTHCRNCKGEIQVV